MSRLESGAEPDTLISVIIPTFNRYDSLRRTLDSLTRQDYPFALFEVCVVDDGSTDATPAIADLEWPFSLRYLRQENSGDAIARNVGAQSATGRLIAFLDDDIEVDPRYLSAVAESHAGTYRALIIGNLIDVNADRESALGEIPQDSSQIGTARLTVPIPSVECLSGVLSLPQADYLGIGMMQPVATNGSSVWCDVEFAYRAEKQGYRAWRRLDAVAYHHDMAHSSLDVAQLRWWRAAHSAVALFERHPALLDELPMFRDKTPIAWGTDSVSLIARKIARRALSSRPAAIALRALRRSLRFVGASEKVIRILENWLIRGAMVHGFRAGLRGRAERRERA